MTKVSETSQLNNMMLKEWLYQAGSDRRRVLLKKFKFNLQRLGLSERKVYRGLLQLMSFPTVVLRPLQLNTVASTNESSRRIAKLRRKRRTKYSRLKLPSVSTDSESDEFRCESHLKILDNNNVSKPERENCIEHEHQNSVVSGEGWGCGRKNGEHGSMTRTGYEQAKDMDSSRCLSRENSTSVHRDDSCSREIETEVKSSRETSQNSSLHKHNAGKAVGELRNESSNGEDVKKSELVKTGVPTSFAERRSEHRRHRKRKREMTCGAESQKIEEDKRNEECRKRSADRCKIISSEGHVLDSSDDTLMSPNSSGGSGSFEKSENRRDTIESIDHHHRHRASSSRSPSSRSRERKFKKIGDNPNGIDWVLRRIEFSPLKKRSIALFERFQIARMKKEALEEKFRAFFGLEEDVEKVGCSNSYDFGNVAYDSDQETIVTTKNTEDVQAILEEDCADTGPIDACEWLAKEIKSHCGSRHGNKSSCDTSGSGKGATETPDVGEFSIKENSACVLPDSSSSPGLQPTSESESVETNSPEMTVLSIVEPTKRSLPDNCDVQSKRIRREASEAVDYDPSLLSESATRPEAPALSLAKSVRATPDVSSSVSEIASTVPNCSPHEPHTVSPSQDAIIIDSRSSIIERDDDARCEAMVTSANAEATIANIVESCQTLDVVSPVKFFEVAFQGNTYGLVEVEKSVVPPISANGKSSISQNSQHEGVAENPISSTVRNVETIGLPPPVSRSNHPEPKETSVEVDCPQTSDSGPLSNTCSPPVISPTVTSLAYCPNTHTASNTMTISPTYPLTTAIANQPLILALCSNEGTTTTPGTHATWIPDVELVVPLDLSPAFRRNAHSSETKDTKPDSSWKDRSSSTQKQCDVVQDCPAIQRAAVNRQQSSQYEQKSVQRIVQEQQQSISLEQRQVQQHIQWQEQQRLQQEFWKNGQQLKGRDKPQSQTRVEQAHVQVLGEKPLQPRPGQEMRFQEDHRYYQQAQQPRCEQPTSNRISAATTKTAFMVNHEQRSVGSVSVPVTKTLETAPVYPRLRVLNPWELGSTNWCPSPAPAPPAAPLRPEVMQCHLKYENPMQNIFLCLVNKRRLIAHRKKVNDPDFSQNDHVELTRIQQEYETSLLIFQRAIQFIMQPLRSIPQTINFVLSNLRKYTPAGVIQFTMEEVTDAIDSSQKLLLRQAASHLRGNTSLRNNISETNTHFGDVLMTERQVQELRQQQRRYFEIFGYKPSSKNLTENQGNQRSQHQGKQVPVIRPVVTTHMANAPASPIETVHASRKQNVLKSQNQTIQQPVTRSILSPVAQTVQKSVIQLAHKPALNPLRKPETHPAQKLGLKNVERSDPDNESVQNSRTHLIQNPEIHSIQKPLVQPIKEPVNQPVQKPQTQSLQKSGTKPFQKTGTQPCQKPGTELFQKPGTEPFQKTGTQPCQKPGTEPFQKPQSPHDDERTAIQPVLERIQPSPHTDTEDRTASSKDPCEVTTTTVIGDVNGVTEPTHVSHPPSTVDKTTGNTSPTTTIDSLALRELLAWKDPNLIADVPPRIANPTVLEASEEATATVQQTELQIKDIARSDTAKRHTIPMIDLTDFDKCTELCDSSTDPAILPSKQASQDDADKQPSVVSFPSILKVQTISEKEFADFDNPEASLDDSPVELCLRCEEACSIACGLCARAFYCSKECQEKHWEAKHYHECLQQRGTNCCD